MRIPAGLKSLDLRWGKYSSELYEVHNNGTKLIYKFKKRTTGPPPTPHDEVLYFEGAWCTAMSESSFRPNSGKYYWEMSVNVDNMKIGVALGTADTSKEMGYDDQTWGVFLHTGECEHKRQERLHPEGVQRKLWRLIACICGGRYGCLLDTDAGTLRLWFNGEYQGIAFNEESGIKGQTLHPAVGIAGFEDNNRVLGKGQKFCEFIKDMPVPAIPSIEKKVIC